LASALCATATARTMAFCRFEMVQLISRSEINFPLGIIISPPLALRMMLARMPIRSTIPDESSIWMMSPILIGRSKSRISPETKLLKMFCSPKPTPTLKAPANIVNRVISKPKAAMATKKPTIKIK
jgi:hypothetical protein